MGRSLRGVNYEMVCPHGIVKGVAILRKINSVESIHDLDHIFSVQSTCCEYAKKRMDAWRKGLEHLVQAMPKFGDPVVKFVGPSGGLAMA